LTFTSIFFVLVLCSNAQDSTYKSYPKPADAKSTFWDKCYSGGDIMLYGGSGTLFFNISPLFGYRPNNKGFSVGIGATYQYSKFTYSSTYATSSYKFSLFGIRGFIRQDLSEVFFVHAEAENYFTRGRNVFTSKNETITIPCANIFLGYKQKYSEFSYYYIMVGYEAIGDPKAGQYVYPIHPLLFKAGYVLDIKGK
jgi:hypothetical protein